MREETGNFPESTEFERVKSIMVAYETELMSKHNVVGVGIGAGREDHTSLSYSIVVMVNKNVENGDLKPDEIIPSEIEGIAVEIHEVGELSI